MKAAGQDTMSGLSAIAFHLFAYVFTNMAMFIRMVIFTQGSEDSHAIDDYAGLGKRAPLLALCMTIALLSLTGVPPLAGFFGKFWLITAIGLTREGRKRPESAGEGRVGGHGGP